MTLEEIENAINSEIPVYYENRTNFVDIDKNGNLIIVSNRTGFSSSIFRLDGTLDENSFFCTEEEEEALNN